MLFEVDSEFTKKYAEIKETLYANYTRVSKKKDPSELQKELNGIAFYGYSRAGNITLDMGETNKYISKICNDADFSVFQFIVLSGISSYNGLSYLNRLVSENNSFGYTNSFKGIGDFYKIQNGSNKGNTIAATYNRLLSVQRSCSVQEYFANKHYIEDLDLVCKLLKDTSRSTDISDELKQAIVSTFRASISNDVDRIIAVYKNVLAAAFGIDRYKGVFTFRDDKPVEGLTAPPACLMENVEPRKSFKDYYAEVLKDKVFTDIITPDKAAYSDRQFDAAVIYSYASAGVDNPIYFPHKVLEIISLCEWTDTSAYVYSPCRNASNSSNLASYSKYLREKFEFDMVAFCAFCCNADYEKLDNGIKNEYSVTDVIVNEDCSVNRKFKEGIRKKLEYYVKCVTTMAVLTSLETSSEKMAGVEVLSIIDFRIKVASSNSLISNEEFCSQLALKESGNQNALTDIENTTEEVMNDGVVRIRDYAYTFNADKVYSRPIFAYKALDALTSQGLTLKWNNMLLGKYADGSLCRSASGEKINLQSTTVHNIYAGSRSGKGVMCFNLFATAIASELPIFYIDRKPDTAVVLKDLAPNMFAVNGGDYKPGFDLEKRFVPPKYKVPEYLKSELGADVGNGQPAGDYMYFRAMMLVFSLIIFIDSTASINDDRCVRIRNLVGTVPIVVFDEFTNFVNQFLNAQPTTEGWFSNSYSQRGIEKKYTAIIGDIKKAQNNLATASDNKRDSCERVLQSAIESVKSKKSEFKLELLYFAELAEDYLSIMKMYTSLINAGGGLVKSSQYFIIGQDIPSTYFDDDGSAALSFTVGAASGEKRFNMSRNASSKAPKVPFVEFLNSLAGDYILGYQPIGKGKPDYLAQTIKGAISSSMLTQARRCFCYYNPQGRLSSTDVKQITNTNAAFNGNLSAINGFLQKFTFFKPFLILNGADTPYGESNTETDLLQWDLSKGTDGNEFSEIEKRRSKGKGQYLGQCLSNCNKAGLTWEDLIKDNPSGVIDSNGNEQINPAVGFRGYITKMGNEDAINSLNKSGEVMNIFVKEVFGYQDGDWLDFLADFRPEALFKPDDFIAAVKSPESYSVKSRLSYYFLPFLLEDVAGLNFGKIFEEELGSLAQFYTGGSEEVEIQDNAPLNSVEIYDNFDSEPVQTGQTEGSQSYDSQPYDSQPYDSQQGSQPLDGYQKGQQNGQPDNSAKIIAQVQAVIAKYEAQSFLFGDYRVRVQDFIQSESGNEQIQVSVLVGIIKDALSGYAAKVIDMFIARNPSIGVRLESVKDAVITVAVDKYINIHEQGQGSQQSRPTPEPIRPTHTGQRSEFEPAREERQPVNPDTDIERVAKDISLSTEVADKYADRDGGVFLDINTLLTGEVLISEASTYTTAPLLCIKDLVYLNPYRFRGLSNSSESHNNVIRLQSVFDIQGLSLANSYYGLESIHPARAMRVGDNYKIMQMGRITLK